jgi:hypothetical protein
MTESVDKMYSSEDGRWMNYEYKAFLEYTDNGKLKKYRKTLSTTNPTWTVLSLNLGRHSERMVRTHLSHGTGCEVLTPLPMKIVVDILG